MRDGHLGFRSTPVTVVFPHHPGLRCAAGRIQEYLFRLLQRRRTSGQPGGRTFDGLTGRRPTPAGPGREGQELPAAFEGPSVSRHLLIDPAVTDLPDLPCYGVSGVVFVGATDDGRPSGLAITDKVLLDLAGIRDTGKILPLPSMRVVRLAVDGEHVVVIDVEPSPSPPVRYRGRVWIRVGPRRAIASADEERRLSERRRAADLSFDARPMHGLTLDELDLALFEREYLPASLPTDVIEENGRTSVERLSALRLAALDGTPTAAGVLLLGIDPTRYLPGAYVQFLRVDGTGLDEQMLDEKALTGPMPSVLRQLDELLNLNIHTAVTIGTGATDVRRPDYPLAALQQLARNAVLHRNYEGTASPTRLTWYDDRIELYSPGGPYGAVTVENFGQPGVTDYRNPVVAEAMRNLGYVQRFGARPQIARRAAEQNGNPVVEFTIDTTYVGITLRRAT